MFLVECGSWKKWFGPPVAAGGLTLLPIKNRYSKVSALSMVCLEVKLKDINSLSLRKDTRNIVFSEGICWLWFLKININLGGSSFLKFMQRLQFSGGNFRLLELECPWSVLPCANSAGMVCFAKADVLDLIARFLLRGSALQLEGQLGSKLCIIQCQSYHACLFL